MELQIQDLISSIKKEGIDAAKAEADRIIEDAKKQAASIVAAAKEEAEQTVLKAENNISIMKESARTDAEQAKRDAVISFKASVSRELEKILVADISKTAKGETLGRLIVAAIGNDDPAQYSAEISEVTEGLMGELKAKIDAGLDIHLSESVRSGFRLSMKDGSGYIDCSDEEMAKLLMPFFSDISF